MVVISGVFFVVVTEFTRKTGDYRSLSATDIRLLALTYQLEKRHVGVDHIKTEPDRKVGWYKHSPRTFIMHDRDGLTAIVQSILTRDVIESRQRSL